MRNIIFVVLLLCLLGISSSCDWVTPWAIIIDEQGNPIPKAKAVCDVADPKDRERISNDQGHLLAPYIGGDVKCTIAKDGYESVTTVFILRKERRFDDPERIVLKKL